MTTKYKFDTSSFIGQYMKDFGTVPTYSTVVDAVAKIYNSQIEYLKSELRELKTKYDFQHLVKENDRLKAENQKLKSEFNEIWTPAFGELKAENEYLNSHAIESKKVIAKLEAEITKLREQVKDYEQALKECEDITFLAADNGNMVHWKPAREVLKKWGEL